MEDAPLNSDSPEFAVENFHILNLEDEIAVDHLCHRFLQSFSRHLVEAGGLKPLEAGHLTMGCDHFLREFIIPERQENIFAIPPERIRQYAGNWYIIKTLEPNAKDLGTILDGVSHFYRFCAETGRVDTRTALAITDHCGCLDYYQERIDSFWAIEDDGYFAWDAECPLK